MNQTLKMRQELIDEITMLSSDNLSELQTFMNFLRFKAKKTTGETDHQGQEQWRTALEATFGMWADREDIAQNGITYTQNIRRGHRLNDFGERLDKTD